MDPAVSLVQAYLRVNGYFTVAEYPVLEATHRGGYRMATDLDLLAFRFPGAGRYIPGSSRGGSPEARVVVDPELGVATDAVDMIIGEVKEGSAGFNPATREPEVLKAAVIRFGCCPPAHARGVVGDLLARGESTTPDGHRIRMVAFGVRAGGRTGPVAATVRLGRVTEYLRSYLGDHWDVLRHAQFKDPVLGFLMTLEKCGG